MRLYKPRNEQLLVRPPLVIPFIEAFIHLLDDLIGVGWVLILKLDVVRSNENFQSLLFYNVAGLTEVVGGYHA